jgi:signal peptidase I
MPAHTPREPGPDEPEPAGEGAPPPDGAVTTEAPHTDTDTGDSPSVADKAKKTGLAFLRELPVLLLIALGLALLIKTFLVQAFYIPSESMEPSLGVGDRVLVNKVVYHLHPPRRADVIVFEEPHPTDEPDRNIFEAFWHWLTQGLGVSASPERDFIKRVIAVPGETIELKQGRVFINGRELAERYLSATVDRRDFPPTKVPPENLFVMGDNRTNSNDSRFGLGFIPNDKVVGRAFVVIWPPSRTGWIRRPG